MGLKIKSSNGSRRTDLCLPFTFKLQEGNKVSGSTLVAGTKKVCTMIELFVILHLFSYGRTNDGAAQESCGVRVKDTIGERRS